VVTQATLGYPLLSGTFGVTKIGVGTLVFNAANTLSGSVTVQAGSLQLTHPAALAASRLVPLAGGTVTLAPGLKTTIGTLVPGAGGLTDVGSGMITVTAGLSPSSLLSALATGRGDGSWNGPRGITSTAAAAALAQSIPRTVGWLDNGDGSISFAFAAPGDTNLDWNVDILDAANFLAGGKFDSGLPATWNEGDFGADGVVDILDAADLISTNAYDLGPYNLQAVAAGSITAVPEPSCLAFAAAVAAGCLAWRQARGRITESPTGEAGSFPAGK
jgi:autotransporter-associated beta strand protein